MGPGSWNLNSGNLREKKKHLFFFLKCSASDSCSWQTEVEPCVVPHPPQGLSGFAFLKWFDVLCFAIYHIRQIIKKTTTKKQKILNEYAKFIRTYYFYLLCKRPGFWIVVPCSCTSVHRPFRKITPAMNKLYLKLTGNLKVHLMRHNIWGI